MRRAGCRPAIALTAPGLDVVMSGVTAGRTPRHPVKFYQHDDDLVATVGPFLVEGAAAGESLLVVATPPHSQGLEAFLGSHGHDPAALQAAGRLVVLDAHATLDAFAERGAPDGVRFDALVGAAVERLAAASPNGVRAYGEMVDILWCNGWLPGALELEGHWHRLMDRLRFTLMCAYRMGVVDSEWTNRAAESVAKAHDFMLPDHGADCLDHAVAQAFEEVVGPEHAAAILQQAQADGARHGIDRASSALFWARDNLPQGPVVMRQTRRHLRARRS